jgi:hypothetical protein
MSLLKKGSTEDLRITTYGKLNAITGLYQITIDFSKAMEHINGDYSMEIHAADYRADRPEVWDLGTIRIWFKEGADEGNNQGVKDEYRPAQEIRYTFHPEQPEKSLVVSSSSN